MTNKTFIDDIVAIVELNYSREIQTNRSIDWYQLMEDLKVDYLQNKRIFWPMAGLLNQTQPYILLPPENSFENQEYALAHEIGHIMLGHAIRGVKFKPQKEKELEANYFARTLTGLKFKDVNEPFKKFLREHPNEGFRKLAKGPVDDIRAYHRGVYRSHLIDISSSNLIDNFTQKNNLPTLNL